MFSNTLTGQIPTIELLRNSSSARSISLREISISRTSMPLRSAISMMMLRITPATPHSRTSGVINMESLTINKLLIVPDMTSHRRKHDAFMRISCCNFLLGENLFQSAEVLNTRQSRVLCKARRTLNRTNTLAIVRCGIVRPREETDQTPGLCVIWGSITTPSAAARYDYFDDMVVTIGRKLCNVGFNKRTRWR